MNGPSPDEHGARRDDQIVARRRASPTVRRCAWSGRAATAATAGRAARRRAATSAKRPSRSPHDDGRGDRQSDAEEERPVVRVDHQREADHEQRRVRPPAAHDRLHVGEAHDEREERLELVHACLLRVVGQIGIQRGEQRAAQAGHAVECGAAEHVGERDAGDAEDEREGVGRALAVAEPRHPDPQQQVIERRRAVLAKRVEERRPRMVRDADGQAFVDPETGVELPRAQEERERRECRQRDRHRPRRCDDVVEADRADALGDGGHRCRHGARARKRARPTIVIGTKSTKRSTSRYPSAGRCNEPSASNTAASKVPT